MRLPVCSSTALLFAFLIGVTPGCDSAPSMEAGPVAGDPSGAQPPPGGPGGGPPGAPEGGAPIAPEGGGGPPPMGEGGAVGTAPEATGTPAVIPSTKCCADEALGKVLHDYLEIQHALVKDTDDAALFKTLAATSTTALTGVLPEESKKLLTTLRDEATAGAGAADLAARREVFKRVSAAMIPLALAHAGGGVLVREAFCPMAQAGWLQDDAQRISNPYYGASMPTCGSFK